MEGDVFTLCAYGPPNYGESPQTDAKESFAVVVLDAPLAEVCPTRRGADCVKTVAMLHATTLEDGAPQPSVLVGRRIRFTISELAAATTGHHHTRIVLWYSSAEDLGASSRPGLRSLSPELEADLLGVMCAGHAPEPT